MTGRSWKLASVLAGILTVAVPRTSQAQFVLTLPKITGVNVFFDPLVQWETSTPGISQTNKAFSFGLESSFEVGTVGASPNYQKAADCIGVQSGKAAAGDVTFLDGQTKDGKACRICENGKTALGTACSVSADGTNKMGYHIELALGVSQTNSYGRTPFFSFTNSTNPVPLYGYIRDLPTASLYFGTREGSVHWFFGGSMGLSHFQGQFTDPTIGTITPNGTSIVVTSDTLSFGFHVGAVIRLDDAIDPYLEAGYEIIDFPSLAFAGGAPSGTPPSYATSTVMFQYFHLRMGFAFTIQ